MSQQRARHSPRGQRIGWTRGATNAAECTRILDPAPRPTDRLADLPVGVETGIMRST
jgi:hypothetical protein